jgi:adiponectin receptor
MAFTFFTSFMYHLFCNKIKWEPFLLQLDFIGILVLLWGSNLPMLYFGYSCKPIQRYLFFGIETGMIILIMGVLMFQTKFNKFRFIFFIGIVFIGLIQAINEYFIHLPIYSRSLLVIKLYTQSLSFYGFGTFIYLFKVPERFWSGKFDYIGNSHNYWHIFVILGAFIQYNNCLIYQEQITNCNNN